MKKRKVTRIVRGRKTVDGAGAVSYTHLRVAVNATTSPRWPLHIPTVTVPIGCMAWIIR